jgi:hypothetical protein
VKRGTLFKFLFDRTEATGVGSVLGMLYAFKEPLWSDQLTV